MHGQVLADHRRDQSAIDATDAILLGLVQGLTEFLPVSSSGHLVLARNLLGAAPAAGLTFEVMVHFGTTLSIITVFWRTLWELTRSPFVALRERRSSDALAMAGYLLLATIPAALVGLLLKTQIETAFLSVPRVCMALLVTGAMLWGTRWLAEGAQPISAGRAGLIGLAQAAAVLPGISRSGATTCVALWLGLPRERAGEFSMLMAVPVILGATALELRKLAGGPIPADQLLPLALATGAAYLSGLLAIQLFLAAVRRGRLDVFGGYCALVGLIGLAGTYFAR